jgi:hypothetical protein
LLSFPLAAALLFPSKVRQAGSSGEQEQSRALGSVRQLLDAWRQPSWSRAVVILLVVGLAMSSYRQCRRSMRVHRDRQALQSFFTELRPSPRDLHVCWGPAMPFELTSPLDGEPWWSRLQMLSLTWMQRTPWHEETKRRFGISSMAQAMYERDDIILVANRIDLALYAGFVKEHFQADVAFIQSRNFGERFAAGRFRQRPETVERQIARPTIRSALARYFAASFAAI